MIVSVIVHMDSPPVKELTVWVKFSLELLDKVQQFGQDNSDETLLTSVHKSIEMVGTDELSKLEAKKHY